MIHATTDGSRSILVALHSIGWQALKNSIALLTWILVCTYQAWFIIRCS